MAGGLLPCGMCLHVFGTPENKIPSTQQRKKYAKWGFQEHRFYFFVTLFTKKVVSPSLAERHRHQVHLLQGFALVQRGVFARLSILSARDTFSCSFAPVLTDPTAYPMSPYLFLFPCSFAHLFLLLLPTTRHPPPTTPLHDHTTATHILHTTHPSDTARFLATNRCFKSLQD